MISPKISVVIPAYNAADTILNCIDSVLQQTVSIYEIIIVNDGSQDNTESIVNDYKVKKNQENLNIISQTNGGVAKARNKGIKEAKGDWIAFLDADDRWLPEKTAKQLKMLEMYPESKLLGTFLFSNKPKNNINNTSYVVANFTKMLFKNYFSTSTILVTKKVLTKYYFDEKKRYGDDHKLWLQIIRFEKGVVLKEGLVIYAENQPKYKRNSISSNLWKMEKGELESYFYLYKQDSLNVLMLILAVLFSILKFIRRYLIKLF